VPPESEAYFWDQKVLRPWNSAIKTIKIQNFRLGTALKEPTWKLRVLLNPKNKVSLIYIYTSFSNRTVSTPSRIHKILKREKTNKMQQSDVYYQLLSQHVSDIIMPIFRRSKTVCYCIWCTALVLLDVVGSAPQPLPTTSSRTSAVNHMQ